MSRWSAEDKKNCMVARVCLLAFDTVWLHFDITWTKHKYAVFGHKPNVEVKPWSPTTSWLNHVTWLVGYIYIIIYIGIQAHSGLVQHIPVKKTYLGYHGAMRKILELYGTLINLWFSLTPIVFQDMLRGKPPVDHLVHRLVNQPALSKGPRHGW